MTYITFHKTSAGQIKSFECIGHSGFRKRGYDIVCASLSALVINAINSIEEIAKDQIEVVTNEEAGLISCIFTEEPNDVSKILLESLELGVFQIQDNYSKYCKVEIKEV